jgi:hypothetical protein
MMTTFTNVGTSSTNNTMLIDNAKTKGQRHGSIITKIENLHLTQHHAKTSSPHHEHSEKGGSP